MPTGTTEAHIHTTMASLLTHLQSGGQFPDAAMIDQHTLLLDHEPEEPLLDRAHGIQCLPGTGSRFVVARVYCDGGTLSVRDLTDPVDNHDLPRALASAMDEAVRRQVAQQRDDAEGDDRYYEAYEAAVQERERHLDGP